MFWPSTGLIDVSNKFHLFVVIWVFVSASWINYLSKYEHVARRASIHSFTKYGSFWRRYRLHGAHRQNEKLTLCMRFSVAPATLYKIHTRIYLALFFAHMYWIVNSFAHRAKIVTIAGLHFRRRHRKEQSGQIRIANWSFYKHIMTWTQKNAHTQLSRIEKYFYCVHMCDRKCVPYVHTLRICLNFFDKKKRNEILCNAMWRYDLSCALIDTHRTAKNLCSTGNWLCNQKIATFIVLYIYFSVTIKPFWICLANKIKWALWLLIWIVVLLPFAVQHLIVCFFALLCVLMWIFECETLGPSKTDVGGMKEIEKD